MTSAQFGRWQPQLHDLGEVEVKHGVRLDVVNLYTESVGNAAIPKKIAEGKRKAARRAKIRVLFAVLTLGILIAGAALFVLQRAKSTKLGAGGPEKSIAVLPFHGSESGERPGIFLRRHERGDSRRPGKGRGVARRCPHLIVFIQREERGRKRGWKKTERRKRA